MSLSPISWMWLWRGLQGRSITFAALFACVVLGVPLIRALHHSLSAVGLPWLAVLLVPFVLFRWLSDQEARWMPDERKRQFIALGLIFGSTFLSWLVTHLTTGRPHPAPIETASVNPPGLAYWPVVQYGNFFVVNIAFGIIPWMPCVPSTTWVTWKSTPMLASVKACRKS